MKTYELNIIRNSSNIDPFGQTLVAPVIMMFADVKQPE